VLPLDVAARFAPDLIFAVQVGPSFDAAPGRGSDRTPPLIAAHNQAMRTLMAAQADETIARGQSGTVPLILVEPKVESGATFAVEGAVAYVEKGYVAATSALNEWRAVTLRR
jgi:predicted acylesterase/phospholipase RssA